MDRPIGREVANIAVVGSLFIVGTAVAGPVGGAVSGVAGEMLAGLAERGWSHLRDGLLSERRVRDADLQTVMRKAYIRAIGNLERRWSEMSAVDRRTSIKDDAEAVQKLFQMLREDAERVLTDEGLRAVASDPEAIRTLGGGEPAVRDALNRYLDSYLYGHNEGLTSLVRIGLEPELAICFAEELKVDRPESNRAWRAYQRLVLEGLQETIASVRTGQHGIGVQLENVEVTLGRIEDWSKRLDALTAEQREHTGELEMNVLILETRKQLLSAVANEGTATRGVVIEQGEETREAIGAARDEIVAHVHAARGFNTLLNADALLRGPIRALGLQADLGHADGDTDRLAAAKLYEQVARRLSEAGHTFHARLIQERRAEALASSGAISAAYEVWLDVARMDLERGVLWIPSQAKQGLDAHRGEVGPILASRANALLGLEAWYEHPQSGARVLQRALEVLVEAGDDWAPLVGCWLGEAVAVDERLDDLDQLTIVTELEQLIHKADEPTSIRIRVLMAEASGDWHDLVEEAHDTNLAPADAGLILCRYGRWLALSARPEEAIRAYRRAIEKSGQANLLGDASGALRATVMIRLKYTNEHISINEDHNLAQQVANEPTYLERRYDAREAALAAFQNNKPPDALRSLRRYLWEARISGQLSAELDAREFLGDLFREIGESGPAIANYIRSGQAKKARQVAERVALADVEMMIYSRAPWEIGTALAVVAAQGDLISPESAERLAPRLLDLTEGVPQSISAPIVKVEAWEALESIALQLPDQYVDPILDRLEPLLPRKSNTYTLMDDSLIELLVRFHRFRPNKRERISVLIANCLQDGDLTRRLKQFLIGTIAKDDVLLNAVMARADKLDRTCLGILAAAGVKHPGMRREAEACASIVFEYRVGQARNKESISDAFERAATFASFLPKSMQRRLATHLLAIAQDSLSPDPTRSSAAASVGMLADSFGKSDRAEAFEAMLKSMHSAPSSHPLDVFTRNSLHPLSRFRIDQRIFDLRWAAAWAAGHLATTAEDAAGVVEALGPFFAEGDECALRSGVDAILALAPSIRPAFDLDSLANHPEATVRCMTASLWADDPTAFPNVGTRLAVDSEFQVRRRVARSIAKVAERVPALAEELRTTLLNDPSSIVRVIAAEK